MPQMALMDWLILFITFSITFILFSMMNYYSVIPNSRKSKIFSKGYSSFNWKW